MRALPCIRDHARSLLILFLLGGFWLSTATSAEPNQRVISQPPAPKTDAAAPAKPKADEPTFVFEMRDKPWAAVFEWLNEHSGLPVIYSNKPQGTFNFVPPKDKKYTIPEIIDALNEGLLVHNFLLIRRDQSFLLVPATDRIDPNLVPRVAEADLNKRGNTEMVSVVIPLRGLVAEDMVSEVKELLGPFGKVVDLKTANQLVVTDTARNLRLIVKTLRDIEDNEKGQAESYSYTCKYIRAREAERILKELLGDPEKAARLQAPAFPGRPGGAPRGGMVIGPDGNPIPQGGAPAAPAANAPKIRMHYLAVEESTNTVLVTGPANKIAQAKDILKRIDVPQAGQGAIPIGKPELQTYTVPAGTADALVKTLTTIYRDSSSLKITTAGNNKILVWATPADQIEIAQYIHKTADKPIKSELIDLQNQDAEKVVKVLQQMFGDMKTGAPFIDADPSGRNAIVVRGAPDQIADVKAVLEAIGETGNISGNTRVISIDKGNAAVLAEALEEYLRGLRKNKVNVVIPGREPLPSRDNNKTNPGRDGSEEQEEPPAQQPDKAPQRTAPAPQDNKGKTPQEPGKQLFDPRAAQSKEGAPITITVVGNRLIIQSEDAKALQMAQELARVLTQAPGGEGQFEIIRLKYANAVEVAKILDEMFTGKQQQNQFNPFVYYGGMPGRNRQQEDKNQPRIVADPATNALLVKASPLELATIRNLITKALDVPVGEGQFEVITLKHASADQVAKVLDEVFTGTKRNSQQDDMMMRMFGMRGQQPTPTGTVRIVSDSATNSLLVKASPQDMKIIHELLDKYLDVEPSSSAVAKTYVIGPLKYANATDVAALVKDVYREHINNNPVGGVTGGSSGFSPFSPFGGFSRRSRSSANQNVDANGNPRAVDLSIGVDDRSNSLVVMCSKAMYEDVKKLADSLDDAARDSNRTIRVVKLQGVDPSLVQQAIDAIQGRTTNGAQQPGAPGFTPFSPGSGMYPGNFRGTRGGASGSGGSPGSSGGGGGGGSRSGSSRSSGQQSRGPDFFEERVTDDPEPTILFDPQHERARRLANRNHSHGAQPVGSDRDSIQLVKHEEQQPAPPAQQPLPSEAIRGPRSNVTAEALPELGVIVVTGNNPADVEEIIRVIELIRRYSKGAEINFRLVPLKNADASYVTYTLNQLFQRVQVGPAFNSPVRATGGTPSAPGAVGVAPGATTGPTSVVLLPIPRQNAILVAAPESRLKDVEDQIRQLDIPNAAPAKATAFPLKKASAARVDAQLNAFYATRYSPSGETQAIDQIRITHDDSTNTVYVQAAPADLAEISDLIARIDTTVSGAVNEIRIVPLKNVTSDEMATIIQNAINQAIAPPTIGGTTPGGTLPGTTPGGTLPGTIPGGTTRPGGTFPGATGPTGTFPGATTGALPGTTTGVGVQGQGATTKSTSLRIVLPTRMGTRVVEAGMLEDIHINSFPRLNSLVIAAPEKSMDLLLALIHELDTLPSLRAELKVFTLRRADASAMAILLQQLFLGVGGIAGPTTVTPGGGPGTTPGAFPGGTPGGVPGGTPSGGTPRQMTPLVVPGTSPEGAPLIELRLSVDTRTNSIIVAGSPNDVFAIELIIRKLEDTEVQLRRNMVYHVRNSTAADLANSLTTFSTSSLQVLTRGGILTPYQDVLREVVVVPEPITNKLLISATPEFFDETMRLITELDAEPPQVVIQVLIAEVDLSNVDEFGVEIGLQSPVLFQRGVFPAVGFTGSQTITNTSSGTTVGLGEVPPGTSVGGSNNPVAQPGFAFNNTSPLGNNPAANAGIVGFQGINNLGVGRMSPNAPVGGFVFSAASDSFSLLIRALKTQGRMEILSRPLLMTLDNQTANIQVGEKFPYLNETSATFGTVTSGVIYEPTGVSLNVTPRISPDGKVLMRVNPSIETPLAQINLGGGFLGTPFAIQTVTTTVLAGDGETVAIGGLIQKTDNKTENKIPWLGDLPGVGVLFRYRQQVKHKTELLIILTPHIVRSRLEADLVLDMESKRMDWTKVDVTKTHGSPGVPPILPPLPPYTGPGAPPAPGMPAGPGAVLPPPAVIESSPLPLPTPVPPGAPATNEPVPAPRPLPSAPGVRTSAVAPGQQAVNPAAYATVGQAAADPRSQGPAPPPSLPAALATGSPAVPASKDTEKSKWSILKPWSWNGKNMD